MEKFNNVPDPIKRYIEGRDIFNQKHLRTLIGEIDKSVFKVMGADDYDILVETGLLDPDEISLKEFMLKIRIGERYLGIAFDYFKERRYKRNFKSDPRIKIKA